MFLAWDEFIIVARMLTSCKNEIPKGNWNTGNEVEDMPRKLLESR